jgi:hypothetical protein
VLAGPACRCPTAALPHLPLSLLHPAFDTGPRCRPAPPVSHAAPRCPRPTALPCSPACLHRERVLPPSIVPPRAIVTQWSALPCRPPTTLSHFPSSAWHRADPPPPISISALPTCPSVWRRRRHLTSLCVHARARAPRLLHRLCAHLTGSRHRRPLLLSSSACLWQGVYRFKSL